MKIIEKVPGYDKLVLPYHGVQALGALIKYHRPARKLKVIGVTGTNGKTTTCFMIYQMLKNAGKKVGLMSTVAYGFGEDIKPQTTHMTTVTPELLNRRIASIAKKGAEYLVLELTSHALVQHRALGVPIDIAVMTNVTHEHLDYHKTFAKYLKAKRRLFQLASRNQRGLKLGIINADDPNASEFTKSIPHHLTYGIIGGELKARQIKLLDGGVDYITRYDGQKIHIKTKLPGEFNVFNSLAAVAVGLSYGLTVQQIEDGIASLDFVDGRMNRLNEGQKFEVIVDYAHTPDSFERLLGGFKQATKGKIVVMFGSAGGRRDPSKRPIQGEIAGKYADTVILTEEDDRDTPTAEILDQIASGAKRSGKTEGRDLFLIPDRTDAIRFALKQARPGDLVLLLGKGNERTIERSDGEHPWHEADTARHILRGL
jgi:UDP-N-acetylmuramoyl-L-alanyl-D-glutamate--2,6-diaminopimelate ligase